MCPGEALLLHPRARLRADRIQSPWPGAPGHALQVIGCPGIVPFPLGQGELRLHEGSHLGSKLESLRKGRAVKSQVKDPEGLSATDREGVVGLANSPGQFPESRKGQCQHQK